LKLIVEFSYGGVSKADREGAVMLHPKRGNRTGMLPQIEAQFEAAGIEPVDGMTVLLVEKRADLGEDGIVCDMEVEGTLNWHEEGQRWWASYDPSAVVRVPSAPY